MKTILFGYLMATNVLGFSLMGIDKWKARRQHWRIPEKTLFLAALLGGSVGCLMGMFLFHHKTRKLRFRIGLPVILVLQILGVLFFFIHRCEHREAPSKVVERELSLIQELDEATIQSFVSYENLMSALPSDKKPGKETAEAVKLFFQKFRYRILSEEISDDSAVVCAEIQNIDTHALARDLCLALTSRNLIVSADGSGETESLNDYFALLRDTLTQHSYDLITSEAYFHLKKTDTSWIVQADEQLQDQLVSGFITRINDPDLLSPEEVLNLYLEQFVSMEPSDWLLYLNTEDIFSTGSETLGAAVDQAYAETITRDLSCSIDQCDREGSAAYADLTITSVNLSGVMARYREKLLEYAGTAESITDDETTLADTSAQYLIDSFREQEEPAVFPVTVTLYNDGHMWQPEISEQLTNAFLGNISEALETFHVR